MLKEGQNKLRYIDWNHLHFALEWIYEGTPSQKSSTVLHSFPGLSAWLVRKGSIQITGKTYSVWANAGDWIFPPLTKDARILSEDLEILSLRFEASWGGQNQLFQEENPIVCSAKDFPNLERKAMALLKIASPRLTAHKNNMKYQYVDIYGYTKTHRVFMYWIEAYLQTMAKLETPFHRVKITDERVRAAKSYLDSTQIEKPFREQNLAEFCGISVAQLARIFVKDMGITPTVYHTERKLRYAKRMLMNSADPIKQIGYELGFNNPANFTNWFYAKTKLSPKAFRQQAMQ